MTFTPNPYSTLNMEGVDVSAVYTPSTATSSAFVPEYPLSPFVPGTRVVGNNDSEWVFVSTATATSIAKGNCCIFGLLNNPALAVPLSNAAAATAFGFQVGISMATAATGTFFWLQTKGNCAALTVNVAGTANSPLYTTATAGVLTTTIATGTNYPVYGITPTSTQATAGSVSVAMTTPELGLVTVLPTQGEPF